MPYPNEHACRLCEPEKGAETGRVARESASTGKAYDVIRQNQKRPDGSREWVDQAYRYPRGSWKAGEARAHCERHDGRFEAAAGETKAGRARSGVARGAERVDREAEVIRGYTVCQRGEALGHGLWFDGEFLADLVRKGNAARGGLKSRFAHPSVSADGLGKFLGRSRDFRLDGGRVRADLHIDPTAHETPFGDLASYVMDLADSDPDAFGASVVFLRDPEAMEAFEDAHLDDRGRFRSPDAENEKHLFHARMKRLHACDVVDDPATGAGFFSEQPAALADRLLDYALGLTEDAPEPVSAFGAEIGADAAKGYLARFLAARGLAVVQDGGGAGALAAVAADADADAEHERQGMGPAGDRKEKRMAGEEKREAPAAAAPEEAAEALREEGRREARDAFEALAARFPDRADFVVKSFREGLGLEAAAAAFDRERLAALEAENAELKAKAAAAPPKVEGTAPVTHAEGGGPAGRDFVALAKARAKADGIKVSDAMSKLARENPDLHKSYLESLRTPR